MTLTITEFAPTWWHCACEKPSKNRRREIATAASTAPLTSAPQNNAARLSVDIRSAVTDIPQLRLHWDWNHNGVAASPPRTIPIWCIQYLVEVAGRITDLGRGLDESIRPKDSDGYLRQHTKACRRSVRVRGPRAEGSQGPGRAGPSLAALRENSVESRFEAFHGAGLTPLVGREEESELLLRSWSRAKTGDGQVVLLSGEAGIGKSRLTATLLEGLVGEPHARLRYFSSPERTDSALHPIIGQMERAANLTHDDTPQARLDKLDTLLGHTSTSSEHVALFAEMLSLPNDGRYPALELTPQQRRQRTMDALILQIEALTHRSPVLMIFEDAHWTDPTSLELLGRVVIPGPACAADRDVPAGIRGGLDRTSSCDGPYTQSAGAARGLRHDRPRRRQRDAAGEHQTGHHRAHRRCNAESSRLTPLRHRYNP
jgi:hypothetical protein